MHWIKKKLSEFGFEYNEDSLITVSTTDSDPTCMAIVQNFIDPATGTNPIQHSFTSMQAHLSKEGYRMYETCKPDEKADPVTKFEAHDLFRDYLLTMGDEAFAGGRAKANCLLHTGQLCEVLASGVPSLAAPEPPRVDLTDSLETIDSSSGTDSDVKNGEDAAKRDFKLLRLHGRWVCIDLGSPCNDWANFGAKAGFAGPYTNAYHIAMGSIIYHCPHFAIHEITWANTAAVAAKNKDLEARGFKTMSVSLCPTEGGSA